MVCRWYSDDRHWLIIALVVRFNTIDIILSKWPFIIDNIFRCSSFVIVDL